MNRNQIIADIKLLMKEKANNPDTNDSETDNRILEEIEFSIKGYLTANPTDAQMWLRLGLTYLDIPWVDYPFAIESLERAHELEPYDSKILMCLAYMYYLYVGFYDYRLLKSLISIESKNHEELSMIEYVKSRYYSSRDDLANFEQALRQSGKYWQGYVNNFKELGSFLKETNPQESQRYLELAENNRKIISVQQYNELFYDQTDVDNFLEAYIKGIYKIDESTLK